MLRLFAHPNYSLLGSLASLTPFATERVKVGPHTNQTERISRIWQISSLVICLAFWKVLLPLSITIAFCYQISSEYRAHNKEHESRLLQKSLITKIHEDRANLTRFAITLTPPTAIHFFEGTTFSKLELVQALSVEQLEKIGGNDRYFSLDDQSLEEGFSTLPKEKQAFLAQAIYEDVRYNLEKALELDPHFTGSASFKLDMFGSGDDTLSTLAYLHMPYECFVKALKNCPSALNRLLFDRESLITQTIAYSTDFERLRAIAFMKNKEGAYPYLESIALILPRENRADFSENLPEELLSKFQETCESADTIARMAEIASLTRGFNEGTFPDDTIDNESAKSVYCSESITPTGRQNLLKWLTETRRQGFIYLSQLFSLDISEGFSDEITTYFHQCSRELRLSLFYARDSERGFLNIQAILEHEEPKAWANLLSFEALERRHETYPPETPRSLIRAISHNDAASAPSLNEVEKIRGTATALELMTCDHLKAIEIPTEALPEVLKLFVELVERYFDGKFLWDEDYKKMALLMERVDPALFKETANHLIELGLCSTVARRIAMALNEECRANFQKICHQKGVFTDEEYFRNLPAPALPKLVANANGQIDSTLTKRLQKLSTEEREKFFKGLCAEPNLQEEDLLKLLKEVQPQGAFSSITEWLATALKEGVVAGANVALSSSSPDLMGQDTPGRALVNLFTNGHQKPTRLKIMNILIDAAKGEEIIPIFKMGPLHVLRYLIEHNKFGTVEDLTDHILLDESDGTKASDLNPNELFKNLNANRLSKFIAYLGKNHPELLTAYVKKMDDTMLTECINTLYQLESPGQRVALEVILKAEPARALSLTGSRNMISIAKDLNIWDDLTPQVKLKCSSFQELLEESKSDEAKFKGIIQANLSQAVVALTPFISSCTQEEATRCFGWATAALDEGDTDSLLIKLIGPGDSLKQLKARLSQFSKKAFSHDPMRQRLIRDYAHLIRTEDISEAFISWNPVYALEALKNEELSSEQQKAFIAAGSNSVDIIDYALSKQDYSRQYLDALAEGRGSYLHLWHFVAKMDEGLKPELLRLDYRKFPAPKTQQEWAIAIEVSQVKKYLTTLFEKGWKESISHASESATQAMIKGILIEQGFWGQNYAHRYFDEPTLLIDRKLEGSMRTTERVAEGMLSPQTPRRRSAFTRDFLDTSGGAETPIDSISPPFTPTGSPLTSTAANISNGHFETTGDLLRTPIAQVPENGHAAPFGGEEGFSARRTLARTPVRNLPRRGALPEGSPLMHPLNGHTTPFGGQEGFSAKRTLTRTPVRNLLHREALPKSSPLASAPVMRPLRRGHLAGRLFEKESATSLAQQIIDKKTTYTDAVKENPQFLEELPSYEEGKPFLFGDLCHAIETPLMQAILQKHPARSLDVLAYLSQPKFRYNPSDPKLIAAMKGPKQLVYG